MVTATRDDGVGVRGPHREDGDSHRSRARRAASAHAGDRGWRRARRARAGGTDTFAAARGPRGLVGVESLLRARRQGLAASAGARSCRALGIPGAHARREIPLDCPVESLAGAAARADRRRGHGRGRRGRRRRRRGRRRRRRRHGRRGGAPQAHADVRDPRLPREVEGVNDLRVRCRRRRRDGGRHVRRAARLPPERRDDRLVGRARLSVHGPRAIGLDTHLEQPRPRARGRRRRLPSHVGSPLRAEEQRKGGTARNDEERQTAPRLPPRRGVRHADQSTLLRTVTLPRIATHSQPPRAPAAAPPTTASRGTR